MTRRRCGDCGSPVTLRNGRWTCANCADDDGPPVMFNAEDAGGERA